MIAMPVFETTFFWELTGFLGMIIVLIAYLQKDDFTVKKLMILSSFFWGIHFYILWVYAGLAAIIIWFIRILLSFKYKKNIKAFLFVVLLACGTSYFTFTGFGSLLPVFASISGAYGYFFLEWVKLRLMMLFNSTLWLFFNFYIGSVSGIINEVLVQVILLATVYRMVHPEGGMHYYSRKVADILLQRSKPDYDRYIFIRDRIAWYRHTLWSYFLYILHYDLRTFFQKKKWLLSYLSFQRIKDKSHFE